MTRRPWQGVAWRIARGALYVVLGLVVLVALLLVVALRTSFAREQIRAQVNAALSEVFQGKIEIDRIGGLTLGGVSGVDGRVFDAAGKLVIRVQGLRVAASLPGLGWQLLAHGDRPQLVLDLIDLDHADVTLRDDEELGVSLAAAFMPRTPDTAPPPSDPSAGTTLRVERLQVRRVWAHGQLGSSPLLDAELTRLEAALRQSPQDGFSLILKRTDLVTRNLPGGAQPRGQVAAKVVSPADVGSPLRLEGRLTGQAAGSPLSLEASWVGDQLSAQVELPELPASFVNERVPALRLDGNIALRAQVNGALPILNFAATVDAAAAHVEVRGYAAVEEGLEVAASLEATRIDAARVVPAAPQSDLQVKVDVFVCEANNGHLVGAHRIELDAGRVGPTATPPLWINGRDRLAAEGTLASAGQLAVAEPGLSVRGRYQLHLPNGQGGVLAATLQAELNDPPRLASLGVQAAGQGEVTAQLGLAQQSLSGKASFSLRHVDTATVQARNVELQANASGTLAKPRLQAATTLDVLSGRAHADLDYSPTQQELSVSVSDVDLIRLSNILGTKLPLEQATLGVTARLTHRPSSTNYRLNAKADVNLGKLGSTRLTAVDFELPSQLPRRAQWGDLKGELVVNGNLQLEALSPLLTRAGWPIERTTGNVRFEVASRHKPDDPQGLELSVAVDTTGLRVVQQRTPPATIATTADAVANQPLALEGIDLRFSAHARPRTGETYGTLILRDPAGTLANVQAETQLPELWPAGLPDAASLARQPLRISLEVPRRRLGSLPPLLRPEGLRGRVMLQANLEGSLAEPRVVAQLSAQALRAAGAKEPVDVEAEVHYAPDRGECWLNAMRASPSAQVASIKSAWKGDLRRAGLLASGESGLVASADVELADFPLEMLPFLAEREVTGRLSGALGVKNWGQDARVKAQFRSQTLSVGKVPIRSLLASAETSDDKLLAEVALEVGKGKARASLDSSMRWGKRHLPELSRNGTAKLEAHGFDLTTLSPMLASYVSEIGGMLDANAKLVVTPTTTEVSGSAKLDKGLVQLPAIGQRFTDISARVAIGGQKVKVEAFTARGTTGRMTGRASASLDGFDLRGADAHLVIDKDESLPLTLEGAAIGDVSGSINAVYTSPPSGERKLNIEVPVLRLVTPDTSGYDLQNLDPPEDIRVGVRRADGTFTALAVQPLSPGGATDTSSVPSNPLRIRVRLGQNVTVEKGRTAKVQIGGEMQILSGVETDVTGRIEVRGGKLDVSGKTFEIERGVVTFQGGDPGNPTVTATARWDAPEYTVYADYIGDVKNGRIKLRSEPPLTPSEIANLLMFGSPEGSGSGSEDPNTAALAVGLAGDTAAKGFNQVLDDFTNLDVSARIDTTTGSARPELVFQVSPRVSARVTRAIGAPSVGQPADRTFLTVELRLRRAWALSAVFGDHGGSALDLIWRRRY